MYYTVHVSYSTCMYCIIHVNNLVSSGDPTLNESKVDIREI